MFWLNNGFEKKINSAFFIEVTSSNFIDICAYTAFESFHNHAFMKSQISILWQNLVGTVLKVENPYVLKHAHYSWLNSLKANKTNRVSALTWLTSFRRTKFSMIAIRNFASVSYWFS